MVCPNCGADFGEGLSCPYCGWENPDAAAKRQRREISAVYEKIAQLLHIPEQRATVAVRILLRGAALLVCLFLLALLVAFIYSRVAPDTAYERQKAAVGELEEYFQAGEYDKMNQRLQEIDNAYAAVYDKYTTVGRLYSSVTELEVRAADTAATVAEYPLSAELLSYELESLFGLMSQCRLLEENGFVYGEEAAVRAISYRAKEILTDTLLLTDAEIEEASAWAVEDEPDYTALQETIAKRLRGESQ